MSCTVCHILRCDIETIQREHRADVAALRAQLATVTAERDAAVKAANMLRVAINRAWKITQQFTCTLDPIRGKTCLPCDAGGIFGDALRATFETLGDLPEEDIAALASNPAPPPKEP